MATQSGEGEIGRSQTNNSAEESMTNLSDSFEELELGDLKDTMMEKMKSMRNSLSILNGQGGFGMQSNEPIGSSLWSKNNDTRSNSSDTADLINSNQDYLNVRQNMDKQEKGSQASQLSFKKDRLPLTAMQRQGVLDRLLGPQKKCINPDCPGCFSKPHDGDNYGCTSEHLNLPKQV